MAIRPMGGPQPGLNPLYQQVQAVDQAYNPMIEQLKTALQNNAVEVPNAPTPVASPFANLGAALGMAATGQGAQYAQALQQNAMQNAQRMDRYQNVVMQARNYDKLREQNLRTAIAEAYKNRGLSKAEAGRKYSSAAFDRGMARKENKRRDARLSMDQKIRQDERYGEVLNRWGSLPEGQATHQIMSQMRRGILGYRMAVDPETDKPVPFTAETPIEATQPMIQQGDQMVPDPRYRPITMAELYAKPVSADQIPEDWEKVKSAKVQSVLRELEANVDQSLMYVNHDEFENMIRAEAEGLIEGVNRAHEQYHQKYKEREDLVLPENRVTSGDLPRVRAYRPVRGGPRNPEDYAGAIAGYSAGFGPKKQDMVEIVDLPSGDVVETVSMSEAKQRGLLTVDEAQKQYGPTREVQPAPPGQVQQERSKAEPAPPGQQAPLFGVPRVGDGETSRPRQQQQPQPPRAVRTQGVPPVLSMGFDAPEGEIDVETGTFTSREAMEQMEMAAQALERALEPAGPEATVGDAFTGALPGMGAMASGAVDALQDQFLGTIQPQMGEGPYGVRQRVAMPPIQNRNRAEAARLGMNWLRDFVQRNQIPAERFKPGMDRAKIVQEVKAQMIGAGMGREAAHKAAMKSVSAYHRELKARQ